MDGLYRTNFGPTDDGTADTTEAHEAWMEVQELVKDGWLVLAAIDYEHAEKVRLWYYGADSRDPVHRIVDAAILPRTVSVSHSSISTVSHSSTCEQGPNHPGPCHP